MSQAGWVKDQLLNQGANHFVIFSPSGQVLESSGDFLEEEKQQLAYTIVQQSSVLLKAGETLKRLSMTFDDVVYVATTITSQGEHFGVFVKRPVSDALASSSQSPQNLMSRYALVDKETGRSDELCVGRNVIGRPPAVGASSIVNGDLHSFIGMESARCAVSRTQAVIDVLVNGDAWLMDCRSTNGTYVSVRPGTGVRLEAERFYQLLPGTRITFGDAERLFAQLEAQTPEAPPLSPPHAHTPRASPPKPAPTPKSSAGVKRPRQLRVCFSGMDADERAEAQRVAHTCGAAPTDAVADADVLVVAAPAARTPKFLIAVGRGIPIATAAFLQSGGDLARVSRYAPSLRHGGRAYTPAALRRAAGRWQSAPALSGGVFCLAALPPRARAVAREVIVGCGGEIPRRPGGDAVALTEESLDRLYDAVLRGVAFRHTK